MPSQNNSTGFAIVFSWLAFAADRFPGHAAWLDGSWKLHRIEDRNTAAVTWVCSTT